MSKIKLNVRPLNLKLKYPFGISRGSIDYAKNVLVALHFGDVIAYGEAAPSSYYGEDQNTVTKFINDFIREKSVEEYIANIHKLKDDLNYFSSNVFRLSAPAARVALEMAFWDLIGKINNKSLYQFFFQDDDPFVVNGNNFKHLPQTSYTIGLDNLLVIEQKVKEALSLGYKILKVKLGHGYDQDLNILKKINETIKNHSCVLRVDVNGGWDLDTTERMLDVLPSYKVELLEQPLPKGSIRLLSDISKKSSIPIFVDEDCMVSKDVEALAGKVHGINIKLMKSGSVIEALNMINLAKSYNLKIMLGCMIESSCAISAAVSLSPFADYIDLDGHLLLESDPFSGLSFQNNKIIPSFEPGLGVDLSLVN